MTLMRIGVLTSGGDAPGMNAAVRAVARTALNHEVEVFAIYEGYHGMVEGGDYILPLSWDSVSGILHQGGTIIGTARCERFRHREGRLRAAKHLVEKGIDGLVIIGGDGSLTGANILRQEWPSLMDELIGRGDITPETAESHQHLKIVGLVGSIDNDMVGTDMTIGADTALHRIVDAIDAIGSTAASHQRAFVVEVMGRRCGYLALMGGLAAGANWVLIPERPPDVDNWEDVMCNRLKAGRKAGRRQSLVVVAEGAQDRNGNPITSEYVRQVLEERMGEDARVTILGHVQRGGHPTAFDRNLSTLLGYAAVDELISTSPTSEPVLIGMKNNRIIRSPLMECVDKTLEAGRAIEEHNYIKAIALRGTGFSNAFDTLRILVRSLPHTREPTERHLRIGILNSGGAAPGMNPAIRTAVRLGLDKGHTIIGIRHGFKGFVDGDLSNMGWMAVNGWASLGGSELGTNWHVPSGSDFYAIARNLEHHSIEALIVVGGWSAYEAAHQLYKQRDSFPAFDIPILAVPATIDNNLPGTELCIGADTALNNIVEAVDKIKQSAVASRRCFVVEVMGHDCGYLASMAGMATGAERVFIPEEGVTLKDMEATLEEFVHGFRDEGRRVGLIIRSEKSSEIYNATFMRALFEEEGGDLFEVRQAILGHLQQGGDPTPFDRILATKFAAGAIDYLTEQGREKPSPAIFMGLQSGHMRFHSFEDMPRMVDSHYRRPRDQWWMELRSIGRELAQRPTD
jgi:6-phosphofructokinase 1